MSWRLYAWFLVGAVGLAVIDYANGVWWAFVLQALIAVGWVALWVWDRRR